MPEDPAIPQHRARGRRIVAACAGVVCLIAAAFLAMNNWRWFNVHVYRLDLASGRTQHAHRLLTFIDLSEDPAETWISRNAATAGAPPVWVVTCAVAPPFQRTSGSSARARLPGRIKLVEELLRIVPVDREARAAMAAEVLRRWSVGESAEDYLGAIADALMARAGTPAHPLAAADLDPSTKLPQSPPAGR